MCRTATTKKRWRFQHYCNASLSQTRIKIQISSSYYSQKLVMSPCWPCGKVYMMRRCRSCQRHARADFNRSKNERLELVAVVQTSIPAASFSLALSDIWQTNRAFILHSSASPSAAGSRPIRSSKLALSCLQSLELELLRYCYKLADNALHA